MFPWHCCQERVVPRMICRWASYLAPPHLHPKGKIQSTRQNGYHAFLPNLWTRYGICLHVSDNIRYIKRQFIRFDVHRAVHRNIISILKPTRCTNVSNLFYFGMTLYMFRTVFPSIISSSRLYIEQQAFVRYCLLARRQQYLFDKCLLLYVQSWTPDDGRKDRPKHVECHSKMK